VVPFFARYHYVRRSIHRNTEHTEKIMKVPNPGALQNEPPVFEPGS
jgi:hypothetical protein